MSIHPTWHHDAVFYELPVRCFADSNGDGIGDFEGARRRLEYLEWLGIDCVWLTPFYPSPLRDNGYDISDYLGTDPRYGSVDDLTRFIDEAHKRGIRVVADLVLNHTSDQHPWFVQARSSRTNPYRDYYVWASDPDRYADARIIFIDHETSNWQLDPATGEYYWHRFFGHQPDLNFENPEVRRELQEVVSFWLAHGIDGFRCDAVPYLFEEEGTSCENLPRTHDYFRGLRSWLTDSHPDAILLAEANQWPHDVVPYFGDGDEFDVAMHFPLMPRLFLSLVTEDTRSILDVLSVHTPPLPSGCQWAMFLRNHDELTLEMMDESEREAMYYEYAPDDTMRCNLGIARRLAPLLDHDRRKIELLNSFLFSLPGIPIIYYGDELGMGERTELPDRDAVRTPMQWDPGPTAGFSTADPDDLYLPLITDGPGAYPRCNVSVQRFEDHGSLLRWMRTLIAQRKRCHGLSTGTIRILETGNEAVLSHTVVTDGATYVFVHNFSGRFQRITVDVGAGDGAWWDDARSTLDTGWIGGSAETLTVGPYGYYWLRVGPEAPEANPTVPVDEPLLDFEVGPL